MANSSGGNVAASLIFDVETSATQHNIHNSLDTILRGFETSDKGKLKLTLNDTELKRQIESVKKSLNAVGGKDAFTAAKRSATQLSAQVAKISREMDAGLWNTNSSKISKYFTTANQSSKAYADQLERVKKAYTAYLSASMSQSDAAKAQAVQQLVAEYGKLRDIYPKLVEGQKQLDRSANFKTLSAGIQDYYNQVKDVLGRKSPELLRRLKTLMDSTLNGSYAGTTANAKKEFASLRAEIEATGVKADTLGVRLKKALSHLVGSAIRYSAISNLRLAMRELATGVIELDAKLTDLQIVSGASSREMEEFADRAVASAKKIASSVTDVVDAATVFRRLGFSVDDSLNFAELTTMYSKVGGVEIADAESAITTIIKTFNLAPDQLQGALDKMVAIGNNFAVSSGELGRLCPVA